jgi:protein phosphatase
MEKIAIISDIHSNVPALEAVYKDIAKRRIRRMICLGDLVGKGPQPAEAVDRVRERCEFIAQGNWDAGILREQDMPAGRWQQEQTGEERLDFLGSLPFSLDFRLSGRLVRLFHASADSVFQRVNRKSTKEEKRAMFHNTERTGTPEDGRTPDVVGYGDIHLPYITTLVVPSRDPQTGNKAPHGVTLFNTGSVGLPYDGIPMPSYVIIEGTAGEDDRNADASEPGLNSAPFSIQLVRVAYDIEKAVEAARNSGMPEADRYIEELRSGRCRK